MASAWRAGIYNTIFLLAVAVVFIAAADPMIRLFTNEAAVIAAGVACLRWVSYGYPFYAWGMVMVQSFNGAGDTYTPTVINFFCYWLFQLPLAYALAHFGGFGATGVFMAITVAEALIAVILGLIDDMKRLATPRGGTMAPTDLNALDGAIGGEASHGPCWHGSREEGMPDRNHHRRR